MPRTKKLARKQTGHQPPSTSTSYCTFRTVEAKQRYQTQIFDRTLCAEKGFLLQNTPTMGYEDYIHTVIAKHNWRQFCAHPGDAVVPVVKEFYAHLAGEGQQTVYVRGVDVPIDEDVINQFYGLGNVEDLHTEFAARAKPEWLEIALENVCVAGTTWTMSSQGKSLENVCVAGTTWTMSSQGKLTVHRSSLTPQCRVWYHFLKTRLMPSTHGQTVSKSRILLLDSIVSGRPIDVGSLIFKKLGACASKKCGSLWFPSLITSLCAQHGVPMFDAEERILSSKGAIIKTTISRLLRGTVAAPPSQQPHDQEEAEGQAPPAHPSEPAAASSSRAPPQADLALSMRMLEQRMSLAEVQQYQTMEMLHQMHAQQQQYWEYAKLRDMALKKSLQKNFTKPIFPFPEFPDGVLEAIAADVASDEVEEEDADESDD